ncbi:MAG: site-2 protease family protein [Ruminococcus sp.]|jgi:Zn-dependent protease|nr:site-2 protease family protein [Ruminococcus sp.]
MSNNLLEQTIIYAIIMLICFPVHECAHAFAAYKLGDDTAYRLGRLTLNPIKHLDLFGSILMLTVGFGWAKPVPINPNNFRNRRVGFALSALAGPVSNLLLAYIFMILYRIAFGIAPANVNDIGNAILTMFLMGVYINIQLAVFNLIPIPPLDGSRVFSVALPEKTYFNLMRYERISFLVLIALSYFPIFGEFMSFFSNHVLNIMMFLTNWLLFFGY